MASLHDQLDSTLALLLLFLVSCFFVAVVKGFRSGRTGCHHAAPPSPPALPVIGNLHQLGSGAHLHRRLQALAESYGPLVLLRLGSVPTLVVSSAATAEAVLRTQDNVFCSRAQQYTASATLYGCRDIAFSTYGERWRQLRRIAVVHLLSARRVDSFRNLREEEVASFVERIRAASHVREEEGVNVSEHLVSLTSAVVERAALGHKLGGMEPGMVHDIMKEVSDLLGITAVSDVFPRLRWVDWATGLDARLKRTATKLDGILERTLGDHERSRGGDELEASDLLDDLLSILKDGDHGFKLDRIDVKALILDLFLAGTDTSYKTIEWTMAELIKNPREMEKVQAQVRQVAAAQGGVHEEDVGKMDMLQASIKEALRLHPPVPLLTPRETIQDTRLHGYDIKAKTRVIVNAWAVGRDSESWENAEEFRPERFMGNAIDYSSRDPRFIPFGGGRRGCPGVAFGTQLVELTLANMMYHFDWELPDPQDLESFEVVETGGFSPGLKSPLILAAKIV